MNAVKVDVGAFHGVFFDEAQEHLATMEDTLLALESAPRDRELLDRIFRAAHSIKGGSGIVGFTEVARFTHALEGLLDRLREGKLVLQTSTSALLLRALDALTALLDATRSGAPAPDGLDALREALSTHGTEPARAGETRPEQAVVTVVFAPGADVLATGMDPLLCIGELYHVGKVLDVTVETDALPDLGAMDPTRSYLRWTVTLSTDRPDGDIRDVFAFVEDSSTIEVRRRLVSVRPPSLTEETHAAVAAHAPSGTGPGPAAARAGGARLASTSTVRVAIEKLDRLVNLVGELVIAQSMLAAALADPSPEGPARLAEAASEVERNTRELQDRVMAIRMVPVSTVFQRFPRVVHDLAASLGKRIRLEIEGEETELDKGMVEMLSDPLTHLVRNAADHGIELPDARKEAGKPEEGVVGLRALHEGGSVIVEVTDDGRGLQTEKIRDKAVRLGLVGPNQELSHEELCALIFAPGFSTASQVTNVSGRGVGMDVVKRNVEAANGTLTFDTKPGKGSCMRIRMPLTMAIIEGLALRVGDQRFVVPLTAIVESFRPTQAQMKSVFGRGAVVRVRDHALPVVRLHEVLGVDTELADPTRAVMCIVEAGRDRAALVVDELLGQAQVVVKSLEDNYRKVDGVTGATILGDGRVAFILDVQALVARALSAGGGQGIAR